MSSVRIAACQYEPHVGSVDENRAAAADWAARAAGGGAQLIVLPELASSGYVFNDDDEANRSAEDADGPLTAALQAVCAEHGCFVVCGINERNGAVRHNSAVLVGPRGRVATYRKLHLFHDEQRWFAPGGELLLVELPFARVGIIVCFDMWFPEPARALALAGADIIAAPTNWVASFKRTVYDDRGYAQGDYVLMATAAQNGVVIAAADRVGTERGTTFLGASIIVGADGWPVVGPASTDRDELLCADVDIDTVQAARQRTPRNHLLNDRRADAYRVTTVHHEQAASTA